MASRYKQRIQEQLNHHTAPPGPARIGRLILTERDREIVRFLYEADVATADHFRQLVFAGAHRSAVLRRLFLLHRYKFVDRLPRRSMSEPYVYVLSKRATNGLALLRALYPEVQIAPARVNAAKLHHSLDLTACRMALENACKVNGYLLTEWLRDDELLWPLEQFGIQPDGFCRIVRPTSEGPRTAGFFLEVERSSKPDRSITEKVNRYRRLYYEDRRAYAEQFGTNSCRVLFLVTADYGINPVRRIEKLAALCLRQGVTFFRFAQLSDLIGQPAHSVLSYPFWRLPGARECVALFQPAA